MGAKKKPQDVLSLGDLGIDAADVGRGRLAHDGARARRPAGARRLAQDRGRRQRRAGDRRLPRGEEARLMTTLVFLEHHGDELQKGSLGVLAKAASLGGDVGGRDRRRGREGARGRGGDATARRRCWVCEDAEVEQPLPQPRVDVLAQVVARRRLRHRALRELGPRGGRRGRPRGAPRRRAQLGSRRRRAPGRRARRQAAGAAGLRARRRRLDVGTPRLALFRAGSFDATPSRRRRAGGRRRLAVATRRTRTPVKLVGQEHEESSGPSIEDADVIVAGGRGLGAPGELHARRGARAARSAAPSARRAPSSTQAGTRTRRRSARPARPSRRSSTSRSASPARSSTRSACRAPARSSRSTRTRTRRSSSSATSASSATSTRSSRS